MGCSEILTGIDRPVATLDAWGLVLKMGNTKPKCILMVMILSHMFPMLFHGF
jgi:hypothetical protein